MNSYRAKKQTYSLAALWVVSLAIGLAAAGLETSVRSTADQVSVAGQQAALGSSADYFVAGSQGDGGCPYPPGAPSANGSANGLDQSADQGLDLGAPEMIPEYRPAPRGPVRPAVFYEVYFPDATANPTITI